MEERIKKSVVAAGIMGFLVPTSSLIYVRREGMAFALMSIFVCSALVFTYTPIAYFAKSLWILIIFQLFVWGFSFFLGIWYAWRGISVRRTTQDHGPWIAAYGLQIFFIIILLNNTPISVFVTKSSYLEFEKNDIIVVQEDPTIKYLRALEYVIFLDKNYDKALGQLLALPGDVLGYENGRILRNDIPYEISFKLPTQPWIVPDGVMLISYGVDDKQEGSPETPTALRESKTGMKENSKIAILPLERIKGKALYILFSMRLGNIGKSLTKNTLI